MSSASECISVDRSRLARGSTNLRNGGQPSDDNTSPDTLNVSSHSRYGAFQQRSGSWPSYRFRTMSDPMIASKMISPSRPPATARTQIPGPASRICRFKLRKLGDGERLGCDVVFAGPEHDLGKRAAVRRPVGSDQTAPHASTRSIDELLEVMRNVPAFLLPRAVEPAAFDISIRLRSRPASNGP